MSFRNARGFSLIEVLVAVALIGVIVGKVLPALIGFLDRGEVRRIADDVSAVQKSAQFFRMDMGRWPASLANLAVRPAAGETDASGATYPASGLERWNGPYLEGGSVHAAGLPVVGGAMILPDFQPNTGVPEGGVRLFVGGLDSATISGVDNLMDGDSNLAAGRIRLIEVDGEPVMVASTIAGDSASTPPVGDGGDGGDGGDDDGDGGGGLPWYCAWFFEYLPPHWWPQTCQA